MVFWFLFYFYCLGDGFRRLVELLIVERAEGGIVCVSEFAFFFPLFLLEAFGHGGEELLVWWEAGVGFVHGG